MRKAVLARKADFFSKALDTRVCMVTLPSVTTYTMLSFSVKVTDKATVKGAYFNDDDYDDVSGNGYRSAGSHLPRLR